MMIVDVTSFLRMQPARSLWVYMPSAGALIVSPYSLTVPIDPQHRGMATFVTYHGLFGCTHSDQLRSLDSSCVPSRLRLLNLGTDSPLSAPQELLRYSPLLQRCNRRALTLNLQAKASWDPTSMACVRTKTHQALLNNVLLLATEVVFAVLMAAGIYYRNPGPRAFKIMYREVRTRDPPHINLNI